MRARLSARIGMVLKILGFFFPRWGSGETLIPFFVLT
jgi:hypothetical protein